jgi:hypothetical protein
MDLEKIDKVLEKLLELHYIEKYDSGYKFTVTGRSYTRQKSGNGWIYLSRVGNKELWLCDNKFSSWRFVPTILITEEEFEDFCKYYNINAEDDKQLKIYNEIEFMDI